MKQSSQSTFAQQYWIAYQNKGFLKVVIIDDNNYHKFKNANQNKIHKIEHLNINSDDLRFSNFHFQSNSKIHLNPSFLKNCMADVY